MVAVLLQQIMAEPQQQQHAGRPNMAEQQQQQQQDTLSLGEAIVGSHHAPVTAPDPWRTALLHDCLDKHPRVALYRTCRAGKAWVISSAKHATLTLHSSAPHEQLQAACNAVAQRGDQPTALVLKQDDPSIASMATMLDKLQPHAAGISDLQLYLHPDSTEGSTLFEGLHAALPNLHILLLHQLSTPLPAPEHLPSLRELHVFFKKGTKPNVYSSVGRFLPQLTNLHLSNCPEARKGMWQLLLNPSTRSTTLRKLACDDRLTDDLVSLICDYTPALQHLSIDSGRASVTEDHSHRHWSVAELSVPEGFLYSRDVMWLPQSQDLTINCHTLNTAALPGEGIKREVLDKLPSVRCSKVSIMSLGHDPDVAALLTTTLQQLATLPNISCMTVSLMGVQQPGVKEVLAAASATLPQLKLEVNVGGLQDTNVPWLLDLPQCVRLGRAANVYLYHDYSGGVWPWADVHLETADASQLLRMPKPASGRLQVYCNAFQINGCAGAEDFSRLQQFLPTVDVHTKHVAVYCLHGHPRNQQPAVLKAALGLISNMSVQGTCVAVSLDGFRLSAEVLEELSALPRWSNQVTLKNSEWLNEPRTYCTLPQVLPEWCTAMDTGNKALSVLLDIVIGLTVHKRSRPLTLHTAVDRWHRVLQGYVADMGLTGQVLVKI